MRTTKNCETNWWYRISSIPQERDDIIWSLQTALLFTEKRKGKRPFWTLSSHARTKLRGKRVAWELPESCRRAAGEQVDVSFPYAAHRCGAQPMTTGRRAIWIHRSLGLHNQVDFRISQNPNGVRIKNTKKSRIIQYFCRHMQQKSERSRLSVYVLAH